MRSHCSLQLLLLALCMSAGCSEPPPPPVVQPDASGKMPAYYEQYSKGGSNRYGYGQDKKPKAGATPDTTAPNPSSATPASGK